MAPKRSRKPAQVQNQEELSRILRGRKITLFIQQVEKEAQERMNELESRLDNLLGNIDQVFKVELMKLPPSIRKMRVGDWTGESQSLFSVQTHSTSGLARCCDLYCTGRDQVTTGGQRAATLQDKSHKSTFCGTMCFSEATKDQINFDLLDDVALCRVQELSVSVSSACSVFLFLNMVNALSDFTETDRIRVGKRPLPQLSHCFSF
uniref:Borealin-2-like n=1 Tax=Hippocampus comes TaxID=109280 RepID=A0A3Q2YXZ1_HIPCM